MIKNPRINLKHYREVKKISQKDLAIKLGITQGYISKIENCIESPTVRMLYRFANALEICPRLLLFCIIENKDINMNEVKMNESRYLLP